VPNHEDEKVRQVSTGNFEGVVGLRKEVVEAQPAQYDLYHGRSVARVPGGDGDGKGVGTLSSGPVPETEAVRALTG
jgi:hypothetical protein